MNAIDINISGTKLAFAITLRLTLADGVPGVLRMIFLVSIGLAPMGPTTASYKSQPVERSSPSGLTGWKQRLDGSTAGIGRNDPDLPT